MPAANVNPSDMVLGEVVRADRQLERRPGGVGRRSADLLRRCHASLSARHPMQDDHTHTE